MRLDIRLKWNAYLDTYMSNPRRTLYEVLPGHSVWEILVILVRLLKVSEFLTPFICKKPFLIESFFIITIPEFLFKKQWLIKSVYTQNKYTQNKVGREGGWRLRERERVSRELMHLSWFWWCSDSKREPISAVLLKYWKVYQFASKTFSPKLPPSFSITKPF